MGHKTVDVIRCGCRKDWGAQLIFPDARLIRFGGCDLERARLPTLVDVGAGDGILDLLDACMDCISANTHLIRPCLVQVLWLKESRESSIVAIYK